MAAINRDELRAVTEKEFAKLTKLLDDLDDDTANAPSADGDVSIKQVIGHRVHWMDLFFGWYEDGKAGKEVHIPAPGYKWNQLKPYNANIYEQTASRPWADVRAELDDRYKAFIAFLDSHDDEELYAGRPHAWTGKWTLGRWAESSGPSHYRSAAKYVRQILRERRAVKEASA